MEKHDVEQSVSNARARMINRYPFFGTLALQMPVKVTDDPGVPTAATDGKTLYFNSKWCSVLTKDEILGVVTHEVLHAAHAHTLPWRKGVRDNKLWNKAADYVVNLIVTENEMKLPENCLLDMKYKDMSTEEVYRILEDEKGDSGSDSDQGVPGIGDDLMDPCSGQGQGDDGQDGSSSGSIGTMSVSEQKALQNEWNNRIASAAVAAKMNGKLPAGMDRLFDEIMNPRIPWYELLSDISGEVLRDDYCFEVPDRRYLQQGIYLPDLYSEGAEVAVAVDTSGSIQEKELHIFLSETFGILAGQNITRIRLMSCDAKIHFDKILTVDSPIPASLPGGGGTDFRPVFDRLSKAPVQPKALIYFTDMYGSFPDESEEPEYPVIWVQYGNHPVSPTFGAHILFNPTNEEIEMFSGSQDISAGSSSEGTDDEGYEEPEEYM